MILFIKGYFCSQKQVLHYSHLTITTATTTCSDSDDNNMLFEPFLQVRNVSQPVRMVRCYGGTYVSLVNQQKVYYLYPILKKTPDQWVECLWSMNQPCQQSLWWEQNKAQCCYATERQKHQVIKSCVRLLNIMAQSMPYRYSKRIRPLPTPAMY